MAITLRSKRLATVDTVQIRMKVERRQGAPKNAHPRQKVTYQEGRSRRWRRVNFGREIMKVVKAGRAGCAVRGHLGAGADAEAARPAALRSPRAFQRRNLKPRRAIVKPVMGCRRAASLGTNPMPRLAGQQPGYIKNQLQAFIDRRRLNPVMGNVAHVLSPAMVDALSTHFKDLDSPPYGGAPRDLMSEGGKDLP